MRNELNTDFLYYLMKPFFCNICHSSKSLNEVRSIQSPYYDLCYMLYQCTVCNSQQFDINEHTLLDQIVFYDSIANEQVDSDKSFSPSHYWKHQVEFIKRIIDRPVLSVLDIGCRTGDFLLHWPNHTKLIGVEISMTSANVARNRGLMVYQSPIEDIDELGKFDVVSCHAILEHLTNPEKIFTKFEDIVSENGILVIMIPSYQTFKLKILDFFNLSWHMYSPPEHLNLYSREYLDKFLMSQGFVLKDRRYTSGGMFNPFPSMHVGGKVFGKSIQALEKLTLIDRFPIFDHMYSYYIKYPVL